MVLARPRRRAKPQTRMLAWLTAKMRVLQRVRAQSRSSDGNGTTRCERSSSPLLPSRMPSSSCATRRRGYGFLAVTFTALTCLFLIHSELEKSTDKASNITSRKALYKRLSDLWPEEGWTTTTYISRESKCTRPSDVVQLWPLTKSHFYLPTTSGSLQAQGRSLRSACRGNCSRHLSEPHDLLSRDQHIHPLPHS